MQYRANPRNGAQLSALGFGCMRFTRRGGGIDQEKANRELKRALDLGVNYFDTAWAYPGSEEALGRFIQEYGCRDQLNIATKLPQYRVKKPEDFDAFFDEELRRLQTDHVDYYLMHMMNDAQSFERLCALGLKEWVAKRRAAGQIRNIGFSFHGGTLQFKALIDAWDWDFCQIQLNYMDERSQAGVEGLEYAASRGLPVVIMEPLRGGKLVNMLPEGAKKAMQESGRDWSPAEWGLRWLYNQPEVTVVLSGMNSLEMVEANCRTASQAQAGSLTEADLETLEKVKRAIREKEKVGCTGCRYCMPCPKGVDIPGTFRSYNTMYAESKLAGRTQFIQTVGLTREPAFASQCIRCGKCEQHCPQSIPIRDKLREADRALRPFPYNVAIQAARAFMFRKAKK